MATVFLNKSMKDRKSGTDRPRAPKLALNFNLIFVKKTFPLFSSEPFHTILTKNSGDSHRLFEAIRLLGPKSTFHTSELNSVVLDPNAWENVKNEPLMDSVRLYKILLWIYRCIGNFALYLRMWNLKWHFVASQEIKVGKDIIFFYFRSEKHSKNTV